jgi:aryl-alcohol dehydrogenase-like predicted oxidoreductase
MQYRNLGTSDLELPVVTFGAWAIGGLFWGGSDDEAAVTAIRTAIDHGMHAIDTAPMYGCGHSERIVARAVGDRRDRVRLLTKCGLRWDSTEGEFFFKIDSPEGEMITCHKNLKADSIFHECEQSLRRLETDVIDLYQVHWPSASAPAEETMGALVKLREQGKIREIGVSNYSARQMAEASSFAPIVSNQVKYNLLERDIESDALPYCREQGLSVICYSPMAMGLLTGKVTMDRTFPETDVRGGQPWYQPKNRRRVLDALEKIRPIADAHTATLAQLATAWVIAQEGVTTALVGARTPEQAAENAAAADLKLSSDELSTIRDTFEALRKPLGSD